MFQFVDAFAGCGGLSLGLMLGGGRGMFAVEHHPDAFATLKANLLTGNDGRPAYEWPDWLPQAPIGVQTLVRRYAEHLRGLQGTVDVVCGGPPCQGYSTSGSRNPADPRNKLFYHYLRLVRLLRPRVVLLENVPGMNMGFKAAAARTGRAKHVNFAQRLVRGLEREGYRTATLQLDASDFGVPQRRVRFFVVGVRTDDPGVGHLDDFAELLERSRAATFQALGLSRNFRPGCRDAIGDLETRRSTLQPDPEFPRFVRTPYRRATTTFQRLIREGANDDVTDRRLPNHSPAVRIRFERLQRVHTAGRVVSASVRDSLGMRKLRTFLLSPDEPAGTVTTLPDDMLHYAEPRILTVRECARLQTFPDWFSFHGPYTSGGPGRATACPRYTQVGNAVPILLARVFADAIERLLTPAESSTPVEPRQRSIA